VIATILELRLRIPLVPVLELAAAEVNFRNQVSPIARVLRTMDAIGRLRTTLTWNDVFDPMIEGATRVANDDARGFLEAAKRTSAELLVFFADRLKVQQREAGVRHDLIDAVFALGGEDDLVRLLARVKALQAFVATDDGTNLLAGYKRAANILKKEGWDTAAIPTPVIPAQAGIHREAGAGGLVDSRLRGNDDVIGALSYTPEREEADLLAALATAEQAAGHAVAEERFENAMAALAGLRAPIDAFFDKVTVNDPDQHKRQARLTMLDRVRAACNTVADFSKIEG
jgi:glycyl-tRNA synthetase beta chain